MKLLTSLAILLAAVPAFGADITLDTGARGWITSSGSNNGSLDYNSYFVGIATDQSGLELRDWFSFDLSSITGTVVSASLQIFTGNSGYQSPNDSETFQLTSVPTDFGFSDLGTGTVYGSQVYTAADDGTTQDITLDAAAIAAINEGGTFTLGGRLTSLTESTPGAVNEAVFYGANGDPAQVELVVTTSDDPSAPEPESLVLFATGLGALAAVRRRRRTPW